MTIPRLLTIETLKEAVLKFARTEDREHVLHPEQLVTCMASVEAKLLQKQFELFQPSEASQPSWLN
jgi:hypothetical protein